MSRLDDAIANVAYILDTLMAYRRITETGDCNSCGCQKKCEWAPQLGETVRYNCPFYRKEQT